MIEILFFAIVAMLIFAAIISLAIHIVFKYFPEWIKESESEKLDRIIELLEKKRGRQ